MQSLEPGREESLLRTLLGSPEWWELPGQGGFQGGSLVCFSEHPDIRQKSLENQGECREGQDSHLCPFLQNKLRYPEIKQQMTPSVGLGLLFLWSRCSQGLGNCCPPGPGLLVRKPRLRALVCRRSHGHVVPLSLCLCPVLSPGATPQCHLTLCWRRKSPPSLASA